MNEPTATAGELEELAQEWAADDRKWNTQDVVAVNLIAFTNAALAAKDMENYETCRHYEEVLAAERTNYDLLRDDYRFISDSNQQLREQAKLLTADVLIARDQLEAAIEERDKQWRLEVQKLLIKKESEEVKQRE